MDDEMKNVTGKNILPLGTRICRNGRQFAGFCYIK
jgi:hypothetical protein